MNDQLPEEDARSDEEIVAATLAPSCEAYSEEYWSEVRILQHRMGAPLLAKMRDLMAKQDWRERELSATVVAQGRVRDKKLDGQCVRFLLGALECEKSPQVLAAICNALGHHESAEAVGPMVRLQGHEDADVRLAIVHALLCQNDPVAIDVLISLSSDSDQDVRNSATFGLGSMTEVDSDRLREALVARLTEADEEIAQEAMIGLALRGDTRVAKPLLEAINAVYESRKVLALGSLLVEAASAIRAVASKKPDDIWEPLLTRFDELGFGKAD